MVETKVDKNNFYGAILEIFDDFTGLTAREVGGLLMKRYHLGTGDRQSAQPRITELVMQGYLFPVGKKFDSVTSKRVTVYSKEAE